MCTLVRMSPPEDRANHLYIHQIQQPLQSDRLNLYGKIFPTPTGRLKGEIKAKIQQRK